MLRLSLQELYDLYDECEILEETGCLPAESKLRTLIQSLGHQDNHDLALLLYAGAIYRQLAKKYMEELKR